MVQIDLGVQQARGYTYGLRFCTHVKILFKIFELRFNIGNTDFFYPLISLNCYVLPFSMKF